MVFKDYIYSLSNKRKSERGEMIKKLAAACFVRETTIYAWLSGYGKPNALVKSTIARELGMPVEELFPESSESETN